MHLSDKKKRINQLLALVFTALIAGVFLLFIWPVSTARPSLFYILLAICALVSYNLYGIFTQKFREREQMKQRPFPQAWRKILEEDVAFYRSLSPEERQRFEVELMIFLHETRITGVGAKVDDRTMILAAASAEIPVFSFPEWEYHNLGEILIYPGPFSKDFRTEGPDRNVLGMVGTGAMQGIMILSQPALISGFTNPEDKQNVGIHEFAHLLDAADGQYDGVPSLFLANRYLEPWLEVMHQETERIKKGQSNMNSYGATNKIEFFAVATEYFFEHPSVMQRRKPELYELMQKIFQQDTKHQLASALKNLVNYRGKTVGRNEPCPCGSGKKYKNCCLDNARQFD
jgi:Mlc titration factor MtfA (ptsG expression regulator)